MATIGGWNGWEIRAETTGKTSNSVSFNAWIYAGQNKVCNWSARTLTVSCSNGASQSGTINAMRFTGPGNSNILSFTFGGLAGNTNYTFTVTYPIRATLDGV